MRKLALPEEVLLQIEQPARYIGNEFNSVVKDKEKVALRGAFLFPDEGQGAGRCQILHVFPGCV